MSDQGAITRSAIGREGFIGDLYDARTDSFIGTSIVKRVPPANILRLLDTKSSTIEYVYTDNISDKFDKLKVDAELQLSILAGLFTLSGSGHYLCDNKASSRCVRSSLLYKITTVTEDLNFSSGDLLPYLELKALELENATHVVYNIRWGANATVVLESFASSEENIKEVEGCLQGALKSIAHSINLKGSGEYADNSCVKVNNYSLKIYADVIPDGTLPQTIQDGLEFMSKVPTLVKSCNAGRGKPLIFTMLPMNTVRKILNPTSIKADIVIRSLGEEMVSSYVRLFEDIKTTKEKLYDYLTDFKNHEKCLNADVISKLRDTEGEVLNFESTTKRELAKNLYALRSGQEIDSFNFGYKKDFLINIHKYFDSLLESVEKIKICDMVLSKGGIYVGRLDNLALTLHSIMECYIFFLKDDFRRPNSGFNESFRFFLNLRREERESKFILVDLDLNKFEENIEKACIWHYKNGCYISKDCLATFKEEQSLNLMKSTGQLEYVGFKPNKRAILELLCPGFLIGTCPDVPLTWLCKTCKNTIEYGFDNYLYCACGKNFCEAYLFRCGHENHGDYIHFQDNTALRLNLDRLRPLKELNILILGETGVGKSTWINSLVNYLTYETLDEAEHSGARCVIPTSFTVTDDNFRQQIVHIGDRDANESLQVGQSATQGPKTYSFTVGDTSVRIIDTPGIGDVRGISKDKENVEQILNHISYLSELHGVCILLKPNESRINVLFRFCVKELLTHLHRSASQNIVFCFTNARSTFYKPGNTLPTLTSLLEELDVEISLSKSTVYCLDNEAFRFLCTLRYPNITYDDAERTSYETSWNRSVLETKRMMQHIQCLKPHKIKETTTLCEARNIILNLTKPMADISQNIQINIAAIQDREQSIRNWKDSEAKLLKNLYMPQIILATKPLDLPRTVCTSTKCVEYFPLEGANYQQIHYKTHCHAPCYLKNVTPLRYPVPELRNCTAMRGTGWCQRCRCSWDVHMHTTTSQSQTTKNVLNKTVQNEIEHTKSGRVKIEEHVRELKKRIDDLKGEQEVITEIGAKFGIFLRENAITPYNDALKDYIEVLIQQEETKVRKTNVDENTLNGLKEMLRKYDEEVKIIKESMENQSEHGVNVTDIKPMVQKLYKLKISGPQLKQCMTVTSESNARAMRYNEAYVPIVNKDRRNMKQKVLDFFTWKK